MIRKEAAYVENQRKLSEGIFSLTLRVSFAGEAKAGQFVSLFSDDSAKLLPRPVSICEIFPEAGAIRLVYRVAGQGTKEFSSLKEGDLIRVMGPLGNGFPADLCSGRNLLLVGGGIGIPPMLAAAEAVRETAGNVTFAVGYRSDDTYLLDELKACGRVIIATDDGSLGVHGTVLDAICEEKPEADIIFACGPRPMLRAVKAFAGEMGIPCYISMEERMACGVGVCLGCVTKTTEADEHSQVKNRRVCTDGPVFEAGEVDLA